MTPLEETDVLIVGAGPAGLTAAGELCRHGVEPLLVERRAKPSDHPRATVISTWSMELLRSWGLEDDVLAGGIDVEFRAWVCETLRSGGQAVAVGYPTPEQSAAVSPTAPACVPQDHLEPVLLRHAQELGARVRFGSALVRLDSRDDGVEAVVRDENGESRRVRARYLIGADGVHSAVRNALAIPMRGPGLLVEAVAALFHAPIWDLLDDRRYGIYWIGHPEAGGVLVPAGRGDRWIYGFTHAPGELGAEDFDDAEMARLIRLAVGTPELPVRVDRIGDFAYTAKLAERFRDGSAFLAGDAAHVVTPRGGTGMNIAIRDGYDLGWKLGWVLRGWAEPALLDSYEAERRPVAEHNIARSADPNGSIRDVAEELHVDLGGRIPHLWLGSNGERRSTLDLLGHGLTLFTGPAGDGGDARPERVYRSAPVTVRSLSSVVARALGIGARGSLIVRPDGVRA